jgi:hypothetical protein
MSREIKFIYPQNLVPAGRTKNEHGLTRMIPQGADGSFSARDLGVSFTLSPEAKRDIATIENNIRRAPHYIPLWRGWHFRVD